MSKHCIVTLTTLFLRNFNLKKNLMHKEHFKVKNKTLFFHCTFPLIVCMVVVLWCY